MLWCGACCRPPADQTCDCEILTACQWMSLLDTEPHVCCCSCRGETVSLNCGHQLAYCPFPRWYMCMESHDGMILTGENWKTWIKTCPSITLSTKIPICTDPDLRSEANNLLLDPWHNWTSCLVCWLTWSQGIK
jgi:hypothetical protein